SYPKPGAPAENCSKKLERSATVHTVFRLPEIFLDTVFNQLLGYWHGHTVSYRLLEYGLGNQLAHLTNFTQRWQQRSLSLLHHRRRFRQRPTGSHHHAISNTIGFGRYHPQTHTRENVAVVALRNFNQ